MNPADIDITRLAALDPAGAIGADNSIPRHIPDDLRRCMRHTRGKAIVMGRSTFAAHGGVTRWPRNAATG